MADTPDKESKTEEATEKKKRDSVEKGQVPFSKEASIFASMLAMMVIAAFLMKGGVVRLSASLQSLIDDPGGFSLENGADAIRLFHSLGLEVARFLSPPVLVLALSAILASVLQNAPNIVFHRIKPELTKISLSKGIKRVFGMQGQTEFLKATLKFVSVAVIAAVILRSEERNVVSAMFIEPSAVPALILSISLRLLAAVSVATIVLVAADLVWSRLQWQRELRMTRQEVKDEIKQAEGDPLQKARRLSLARDRSRRRMIAAVPEATLVIANPTHYAVALRYRREEGGAPMVLAKGQDLVALKIREVAEGHDIPVVEDKLLARTLHDAVKVDQLIPAEFYRAVAEIICFLQARMPEGPGR